MIGKIRRPARSAERRVKRLARRAEKRVRVPRVAALLAECAPLRPAADRQKVVILVSAERSRELRFWLPNLRRHRVLVVGEGAVPRRRGEAQHASSLAEIHEALKRFGATHLLIDLRSGDVAEARETWLHLVFHLRHGGAYLLPQSRAHRKANEAALIEWSADIAGVGRPDAVDAGQRTAAATVALLPGCLAITKKGHHFLTVGDDEVATLLPVRERGAGVEVVHELPSGEFRSRVVVDSHDPPIEVGELPERMPYPSMRLRHYTAPIVFAGRTLLYTGHSVLPDSFRFYRSYRLEHPELGVVSEDFRTMRAGKWPREDLDGDFFVLDPQWSGHFGHIMTEVVPRLWAWEAAKARFPDVKVLYMAESGKTFDPLITRLATAYGIAESDLVAVQHPVRVRSVLAPTAMWHNFGPHFVHPDVTQAWERIGTSLADPSAPTYERIFVSRRPTQPARVCHNQADVEELFRGYGFTIVYPEEHDVAGQAALFRSAKVIAGFGGSAMFNLMYARKLEDLIVLIHEAYTARNEHLYSSLIGGRAHYYWSKPDVPRTPGVYNSKAFVSNWTFDFERNQVALEKLLTELG